MTIRVVLADDQALIREGFHAILERSDDIRVVGEASDGIDAVTLVQRTRPDIVIMDVRMPRLNGIEATAQLSRDGALADTRVLVVTTYEIDEYVFSALRAGASGFLLKDLEPEELRHAVRVVAAGESLLAPRVTRRLIAQFVAAPHRTSERDTQLKLLTGREREIVILAGQGLSNAEIGSRLYISPATAKTHLSRAMLKLDLRNRAQLVIFAYESGLVTAPRP